MRRIIIVILIATFIYWMARKPSKPCTKLVRVLPEELEAIQNRIADPDNDDEELIDMDDALGFLRHDPLRQRGGSDVRD